MQHAICRFYESIEQLRYKCCRMFEVDDSLDIKFENFPCKPRCFRNCTKGVYFFFDTNELRDDGATHRVVRIGTHAIKHVEGKKQLWERLREHKGIQAGGGDHTTSIFRDLVGKALNNRDNLNAPICEEAVSNYIRGLPFLVLKVDDKEHRKFVESRLISLLSNVNRGGTNPDCSDEPSDDWLGRHSDRPKVVDSGLWNNQHTEDPYNRERVSCCLSLLREYVNAM